MAPHMLLRRDTQLPGPLSLHGRGRLQEGGGPVGRRARPPGPGEARPGRRQPAAPGRADQSPRHPVPGSPPERADGLRRDRHPGFPRPLPDRRPGDPGLGDRQGRRACSRSSRGPTPSTGPAGRQPRLPGRRRRTTAVARSARHSARRAPPRTARSPRNAGGPPGSPKSQSRIAALEAELTELGKLLADPPSDRAEVQRAGERYMTPSTNWRP